MFDKYIIFNSKIFFVFNMKHVPLMLYANLIFKGHSVIKHFVPFQMGVLWASFMGKNLRYFLNFIRTFQVV